MRILLVTQWFDPEPIFKGLLFARELQRRGHQVEVLTGFPNYPGGRLYPGHRIRPWKRETMDGVRVTRLALFPSHDRSAVRRSLTYASFAASAAVLGGVLAGRADVVYVYHPPLTTAAAGLILGLLRRAPVVLDVQDLWPETVQASGMVRPGRLMRALGAASRAIYRSAARVVVLSPGFARRLAERGVAADRIDVIYNWCDEASMASGVAVEGEAGGRFRVVYAGNMGPAQGLDTVLEAARICRSAAPHVEFHFVGSGIDADRLRRRTAELELRNVHFLGRRAPSEMGEILAAAGALLVHLAPDPLFEITIPSKTQAYLAAGRPILMAVAGDAAALVEAAGGGITCPPGDAPALAAAVQRLAAMPAAERAAMGAAGRAYYREHLSLSAGVDRFEEVFRRATGAS
ncbi:MAG TPA: glycosyltransferase family 4 protein [Longimicrobiaceae bacterium]|nr:glycosyltransferase family 4 protein [Longimicrobiaceae bacterium]